METRDWEHPREGAKKEHRFRVWVRKGWVTSLLGAGKGHRGVKHSLDRQGQRAIWIWEEVWTWGYQSNRKTLVTQCDNMMSLSHWKILSDSCVAGKRGEADGRGRKFKRVRTWSHHTRKGYSQGSRADLLGWFASHPPSLHVLWKNLSPGHSPWTRAVNHSMMKIQPVSPSQESGVGIQTSTGFTKARVQDWDLCYWQIPETSATKKLKGEAADTSGWERKHLMKLLRAPLVLPQPFSRPCYFVALGSISLFSILV